MPLPPVHYGARLLCASPHLSKWPQAVSWFLSRQFHSDFASAWVNGGGMGLAWRCLWRSLGALLVAMRRAQVACAGAVALLAAVTAQQPGNQKHNAP